MFECGSCSRHIREDEAGCPFCGAAVVTTVAPGPGGLTKMMVLSAGLGLLACTPGTSEEGAESQSTTTMMGSATSTETTNGDGDGDVTTDPTERGAEAYGAPELPCDEWSPAAVMVGDNPVSIGEGVGFVSQSCGGTGTPSLYAFTALDSGDYEFAVIDADFEPVLSLIGFFCEPPDELACSVGPETATVGVVAGNTVYVAIDDVDVDVEGSATLTITAVDP